MPTRRADDNRYTLATNASRGAAIFTFSREASIKPVDATVRK